jgi:hypothetical protein
MQNTVNSMKEFSRYGHQSLKPCFVASNECFVEGFHVEITARTD